MASKSIAQHELRRPLKGADGKPLLDPETGKRLSEKTGEVVWRARYRDSAGKEHAKHFKKKTAAQRWLDEVTASIVTGHYVDPNAGKITFKAYAEGWRKIQQHKPSTAELVERILRLRVYPVIGDEPIGTIRHSQVQAMVSGWKVSPATAKMTFRFVQTIFRAAVRDKKLMESPCVDIRLKDVKRAQVRPPTTEQVQAVIEALPERYRALAIVAAGTGMRQGEVFGLTLDRVAFLERTVTVDRQLVGLSGREPEFGPPKTLASDRVIPLPKVVIDALTVHTATFDLGDDGLLFTGSEGQKLRRSAFGNIWRDAVEKAGVKGLVFHSLRHYYASLLIRHGESVKVVQERLGHASADETLKTYAHLWPDADDRTRTAVDLELGNSADSLRTQPKGA